MHSRHCYTAKYLKGTGPVGERQEPVTGGEIWQHSELDRELKPIIPLVQTTSESPSPVRLMAGSNPSVCVRMLIKAIPLASSLSISLRKQK